MNTLITPKQPYKLESLIMKMGWWPCSCCFGCFYRCFQVRKKSKQNAIEPETLRSPTPSIALSGVSGGSKNLDDVSIQEQLSLFYYGSQNSGGRDASGRRYSHPNQIKFVEEYEKQRRASTTSSSHSQHHHPMMSTSRSNSTAGIIVSSSNNLTAAPNDSPPQSPVMMFPVIPPGIKITNTDDDDDKNK